MNANDNARPTRPDVKPAKRPGRFRRRVVLIVLGAAVVLSASILSQAHANRIVYSAKVGRVVDHATGKGIPGVTVLAAGHFSAGLYHGTRNICLYGVTALTDADGNFELPSTWSRMAVTASPSKSTTTWDFSIVKLGYVMTGDQARIKFDKAFDKAGYLQNFIGFRANPYTTSWSGNKVRISTIEMEAATLSLTEQMAYYGTMAAVWCANDATSARANLVWEHQMFNYWKPQVCSAPPDETVNTPTAMGLNGVSPGWEKFKSRLIQLDPIYESHDPYSQPHQYRLGDLCQAMMAGEVQ